MSREHFKNMPEDIKKESPRLLEFYRGVNSEEPGFIDFNETLSNLSRNYLQPSQEFFLNTFELADDPIKAASLIESVNPSIDLEFKKKDFSNALLAAAKVETAKQNLQLNKEQKNFFNGLVENFIGASAWLQTKKNAEKAVNLVLIGGLITGCTGVPTQNIASKEIEVPATAAMGENAEYKSTSNVVIATNESPENISSSDYPRNAKNFIVNKETSKEQLEIIWNSENSYYKERLSVYLEAIRLSKQNPDNFKTYVSVYPSDGETIEAWAFVMRDKSNGDLLIPAKLSDGIPYSDLIVSPSEKQDSLRLVRISSPDSGELRIIFDKSKWPIIITDSYSKWYNSGYAPIGWKDISDEELGTIEILDIPEKILISTNIENPSSWPEITVEQLPEYVQLLKDYVKENKILADKAFNSGAYGFYGHPYYMRLGMSPSDPSMNMYRQDHEYIPKKSFAFAKLHWEIPELNQSYFTVISQLWLDENNTPSIILNYIYPCIKKDCPGEDFTSYINSEELISGYIEFHPSYFIKKADEYYYGLNILAKMAENYPLTTTKGLLLEWFNDQKIPKDLENKLLPALRDLK